MSKNDLVRQAEDLYATLTNPAQKGLGGTIALTKLKRVLKKIGELPPELSKITSERLEEFRNSNLIASADIALGKVKNSELDVDKRIQQLDHVHHYLDKAECGWQAIGLTQRNYIELKFNLLCDQMADKSDSSHGLRHYQGIVIDFLTELSRKNEISHQAFLDYSRSLAMAAETIADEIKKRSTDSLFSKITSVEEGLLSAEDSVIFLDEAFSALRESSLPKSDFNALYTKIGEMKKKVLCEHLKSQYDTIAQSEHYGSGHEALEKLENELRYNGLEWKDIGISSQEAQKQRLQFDFAQVTEQHANAIQLFQEGKIQDAFSQINHAQTIISYSDFNLIGEDSQIISDSYKTILKAKLKKDFDSAVKSDLPARNICWTIEDIESSMLKNSLSWSDIEPSLNPEAVQEKTRPLKIRAAQDEINDYLERNQWGCIGNAARFLSAAQGGWEEMANIEAVKEAAEKNGTALPALRI